MPNPKRRQSKSRTSKRRTHDHLDVLTHRERATPFGKTMRNESWPSLCPNCGEPKRPHRVCPECGQYRGREIVEVESE